VIGSVKDSNGGVKMTRTRIHCNDLGSQEGIGLEATKDDVGVDLLA
jgi:hypothetical protein